MMLMMNSCSLIIAPCFHCRTIARFISCSEWNEKLFPWKSKIDWSDPASRCSKSRERKPYGITNIPNHKIFPWCREMLNDGSQPKSCKNYLVLNGIKSASPRKSEENMLWRKGKHQSQTKSKQLTNRIISKWCFSMFASKVDRLIWQMRWINRWTAKIFGWTCKFSLCFQYSSEIIQCLCAKAFCTYSIIWGAISNMVILIDFAYQPTIGQ